MAPQAAGPLAYTVTRNHALHGWEYTACMFFGKVTHIAVHASLDQVNSDYTSWIASSSPPIDEDARGDAPLETPAEPLGKEAVQALPEPLTGLAWATHQCAVESEGLHAAHCRTMAAVWARRGLATRV